MQVSVKRLIERGAKAVRRPIEPDARNSRIHRGFEQQPYAWLTLPAVGEILGAPYDGLPRAMPRTAAYRDKIRVYPYGDPDDDWL